MEQVAPRSADDVLTPIKSATTVNKNSGSSNYNNNYNYSNSNLSNSNHSNSSKPMSSPIRSNPAFVSSENTEYNIPQFPKRLSSSSSNSQLPPLNEKKKFHNNNSNSSEETEDTTSIRYSHSPPPPIGSGAKFMRISKRTSLIVDNNERWIDDNKSGSISKLRENRVPSNEDSFHRRNSSISSILTDNISMISSSDGYESCNDYDQSNKCKKKKLK